MQSLFKKVSNNTLSFFDPFSLYQIISNEGTTKHHADETVSNGD